MRKLVGLGVAAVLCAAVLGGSWALAQPVASAPAAHAGMWANVHDAVAVVHATAGNTVHGVVRFTDVDGGVHVTANFDGLPASSTHGFHIHEFGDESSDNGLAAGGHFNPEGHKHGAPDAAEHHAGDLGNVVADANGHATLDVVIKGISVAGMQDPIVGRGLVIHKGEDDLKTQPTGNAGDRIGVGVIGIAKAAAPKAP